MCEVGVAVEVPNRGYFGAELGSGGCFCLGRPNLCIRATSLPRLLLPSFTATAHCTPGRVCLACHEADSRRSLPAHGRYCMRHRRRHQCCECARATGCVGRLDGFKGLRWRCIGGYIATRTTATASAVSLHWATCNPAHMHTTQDRMAENASQQEQSWAMWWRACGSFRGCMEVRSRWL